MVVSVQCSIFAKNKSLNLSSQPICFIHLLLAYHICSETGIHQSCKLCVEMTTRCETSWLEYADLLLMQTRILCISHRFYFSVHSTILICYRIIPYKINQTDQNILDPIQLWWNLAYMLDLYWNLWFCCHLLSLICNNCNNISCTNLKFCKGKLHNRFNTCAKCH